MKGLALVRNIEGALPPSNIQGGGKERVKKREERERRKREGVCVCVCVCVCERERKRERESAREVHQRRIEISGYLLLDAFYQMKPSHYSYWCFSDSFIIFPHRVRVISFLKSTSEFSLH